MVHVKLNNPLCRVVTDLRCFHTASKVEWTREETTQGRSPEADLFRSRILGCCPNLYDLHM